MSSGANRQILTRIDKVFDYVVGRLVERPNRPAKKRRLNNDSDIQGGFIIGDVPGGFILDDSDASEQKEDGDTIPLSCIPEALQLLDLQPDDHEVLSVFRNAASGWSNRTSGSPEDGGEVARTDFRSVCLVLLGGEEETLEDSTGETILEAAKPLEIVEDSDGESDAYEESSLSSLSNDEMDDGDTFEDEEFQLASQSKSKSRKKKSRQVSDSDPDFITSRTLSARQRKVCLDAFQMFFPTARPEDLPIQRIYLKDLTRVTESLRERIKAEEMVEMLSEFSTSPDKSISLQDFEKIMIATKLA